MNDLTPLERVRAYYRDLNTGDRTRSRATSTPTRTTTTRAWARTAARRQIGEMTEQGVKHLDASWHLEHAIEQGDEVVIEWTMLWRDPRHDNERRSTAAPSGSSSRTG